MWGDRGLGSSRVFHWFLQKPENTSDLRSAIRKFRISGLECGHDCDPSKSPTLGKMTPTMPVSGFRKTRNIKPNDSVLLWFSKTDAKLCGAIVGLDRLGFSIGFCKNPKPSAMDLPFQTCAATIRKLKKHPFFRILTWSTFPLLLYTLRGPPLIGLPN